MKFTASLSSSVLAITMAFTIVLGSIIPTQIGMNGSTASLERRVETSSSGLVTLNGPSSKKRNPVIAAVMDQFDDSSIADIDFFRFTQENLLASGQGLFYYHWSIEAREAAEYHELGEWSYFVKEFAGTYNFKCPLTRSGCVEQPRLSELMVRYPENRPLARVVYFTILKYAILHDYAVNLEHAFDEAYKQVSVYTSEIIEQFTLVPDADRVLSCEQLKKGLKQILDQVISLATAYLGEFSNPSTVIVGKDFLESLQVSAASTHNKFSKAFFGTSANLVELKWKPETSLDDLVAKHGKKLGTGVWNKQRKMDFSPFHKAVDKTVTALNDIYGIHHKDHKLNQAATLSLAQGYSQSPFCGAWEGETADNRAANTVTLERYLIAHFKDLKKEVRAKFEDILSGRSDTFPGGPSLMALMFATRSFVGEGSMSSELDDFAPVQDAMVEQIMKQVIAVAITSDGGYMKCTHRKDAPELCRIGDDPKLKATRWETTLFCPRREADPELICQTGRWYYEAHFAHERALPALVGFKTFTWKASSSMHPFTLKAMLQEAYDNFVKHGNSAVWQPGNDSTVITTYGDIGFRMAVCQNDWLELKSYGLKGLKGAKSVQPHERHTRQWAFPAFCGDFRASDTRAFLDSIQAGQNSNAYQNDEFGMEKLTQGLFRDRIPRTLEGVPPFSHYMVFGEVGIQYPVRGKHGYPKNLPHNYHRVFRGVDQDFEKIKKDTAGMTEYQANLWFCLGAPHHTVFQRERSHQMTTDAPIKRLDNHHTRCKKWLKSNPPRT